MPSLLIDCLGTTDALAAVFSDTAVLGAMVEFEVALAAASADAGAIPRAAADAIGEAARCARLEPEALAQEARASATPAIPLVRKLSVLAARADPESSRFVHWGATSQDVTDTALVLLLKRARPLVSRDQARLAAALRRTSDEHAASVMVGRTLLQPAVPITFGLKVAGWGAAVGRAWARLDRAWGDALVVQYGGAAGTRAAAGPHAAAIAQALAGRLGLEAAPPWHADRDRLGAFVAALALYTAALAKAARDIALLMQGEVGEVAEPGGGSSTMPQKRNPSGCAIVLAAAARLPGLAASLLGGAPHEHERSVGSGGAEWPTVAAAVQASGAAAHALAGVMEGLTVDAGRMRTNLERTGGVIFAEAAVQRLAPALGKEQASALVADAVRRTRTDGEPFAAILRTMPEVLAALAPADLADLSRPESYLGDAEAIRRELLSALAVPGEPPA